MALSPLIIPVIFANYDLDLQLSRVYVCVYVFTCIYYKQEPYATMLFIVFYFWNSELVILK